MKVYVPAARVAEIVSVVPGPKARSFVARLRPEPLMTSAWSIVPTFRASKVTGVPAFRVTVDGVIEYSLSESVTVAPDPDGAPSDAGGGEPAGGGEAGGTVAAG